MSISNVVSLFGGVAMFLFGMSLMGDGLKKVAGSKLEVILYKLTSNSLKGILLGTGVTAVIQSSSATSVMVVGFVNSGMMKIKQAIGIIMGAIIGTSITGWIICLSSMQGSGIFEILSTDTLTTILAVIGIILLMFTKGEKNHHVAGILLGFSVLMFGISAMSDAVYPLRESEAFIDLLTTFKNPLVGVLAGLVFTSIIQSASAAVGILQALAVTGAISFGLALPVLMGIAIGASVPVLLSALGANVNGRRTAMIYLVVDTVGSLLFGALFYILNGFIHFSFIDMPMNMVSIALLNTMFRIIMVLMLAPFIGLLEKFVERVVKDRGSDNEKLRDIDKLEERFLRYPALAIEQTKNVVSSMADHVLNNVKTAFDLLENYSEDNFKQSAELESVVDIYEDKLGKYISKIMQNGLDSGKIKIVSMYLHSLTDLERISDHALNVSETVRTMKEKNIALSEEALSQLDNLIGAVMEIVQITINAFTCDDLELSYRIEPLEELIDELCDKYKSDHIERVQRNECIYEHSFVFNDMLTDLERIGDHCSNIGLAIRMEHDEIDYQHGLLSKKHIEESHAYSTYMQEYIERFPDDQMAQREFVFLKSR